MHDFTADEAESLTRGLQSLPLASETVLARILHWTGGHPYLTQKLCQAITEDHALRTEPDLDQKCETLFLSFRAREHDDNLLFVREQLLRGEADRASLLSCYELIRRGKRLRDDEANPLVTRLRLSGIVRAENGWLKVRNRIYAQAFDKKWVASNLPDAEVRRQRAAYWRGVRLTALASCMIIAIVGGLAWYAFRQVAENRRLFYLTHVKLAYDELNQANTERARELLAQDVPKSGWIERYWPDLRGFEWYVLQQQAQNDDQLIKREHPIEGLALLSDQITLADACAIRTRATGNDGLQISLSSLATNRVSASFTVPLGPHFATVAFSPDQRLVAVNDLQNRIALWELSGQRSIVQYAGHRNWLSALAFSADGKHIASADFDGSVHLWNPANGETLRSFTVPRGTVIRRLAFSPNGQSLAIVNDTDSVTLWEVSTGKSRTTLSSANESFMEAVFFPNGQQLLTATSNGDWEIWDIATARPTRSLISGHAGDSPVAAISSDGNYIVTGNTDRTVRLWKVAGGTLLQTQIGFGSAINKLAWSDDNRAVVIGSEDGRIKLWRDFFATANTPERDCVSLAFNAQNELFGVCKRPQLSVQNLTTGRTVTVLGEATDNEVFAAFSADVKRCAVSNSNQQIQLWELNPSKLTATLTGHTDIIKSLDFSPDNRFLVSGGSDHAYRLWNLETMQEAAQLKTDVDTFLRAVFSRDSQTVTGALRDGNVALWDTATRKLLRQFKGHTNRVRAIAFSPNGRLLATGGQDNRLILWDVATGQKLRSLGHTTYILRLAFSPDGERLATGGLDGTIKLWDVTTGYELATLQNRSSETTGLAFSQDGKTLAASNSKKDVRIWTASTATPMP